jgi:hypothetical protein
MFEAGTRIKPKVNMDMTICLYVDVFGFSESRKWRGERVA